MNNNHTGKFAAIYVRTSSEHQAEKSSPDEQESDCKRLAAELGLSVIAVYRDIEKYRVKNRLVEPSGTRADRPGLVAMLNDAAAKQFDTILAWREDRLYRGMRAMLSVLETIQENSIKIVLARETFDPRMAPIKAWVAQMELDGMKERMSMGVKARLRSGKANTGQGRYGYQRVGDVIKVVEEEAYWVRKVFEWYNQRVPFMEIRKRLIEGNAPQKGSSVPRKIHWARTSIQAVLKGAYEYTYGIKKQSRTGETFQISVPPIIDQATYFKYLEVKESNMTHPSHNLKHDYLVGGMLFCDCGRKWSTRTNSYTRKNRKGEKVDRKSLYGTYYCPQVHKEHIHSDCPRTIGSAKLDNIVWDRVCSVIRDPAILLSGAKQYIEDLKQQAENVVSENERLQQSLDGLTMERQWVITQARKGKITDEDMDYQLGAISLQEISIKRELAAKSNLFEMINLNNWEEKAEEYLLDLQAGLDSLNTAPQTDEERREVFSIKRQIVQTLVDRVHISKDKQVKVVFRLNLLQLLGQPKDFSELQPAGIYTRTPACPVRPHLAAPGA